MVRDSQLDLAKLISQQLLFRSHQITCGLTLYETLVLVQYTVHNKFFTNNHLRVGWVSSQLGFRGLGEADISPNCHVVNGIVDAHVLEQGLSFRYFLDIHCISSSKAKYVQKSANCAIVVFCRWNVRTYKECLRHQFGMHQEPKKLINKKQSISG